jgi:hypothetical protein
MRSWRTTLGGVLSFGSGIGLVCNAAKNFLDHGTLPTVTDWGVISTAFSLGWVAFHARDNKVSDEKAGAKGP